MALAARVPGLAGRLAGSSRVAVAAPQRAALRPPALARRGAVQVVAAEAQDKKRTDSAVKRADLAEERRMRNKSRKSAIATYMKKVTKLAESVVKTQALDEQQVAALDRAVADAFSAIDKAVIRGTLHHNTGDRRKARVSKYKRQALIAAGLYAPQPEQPGYFFYQRIQARKAAAAAAAGN
ncbi:RPS20 [Scenedesmus sp. PABB004]|nr:RPS20 [Scenedesmus sp. PABB004]